MSFKSALREVHGNMLPVVIPARVGDREGRSFHLSLCLLHDMSLQDTSQRSYGTYVASGDSDMLASGFSQSTANHGM